MEEIIQEEKTGSEEKDPCLDQVWHMENVIKGGKSRDPWSQISCHKGIFSGSWKSSGIS